VYGDKKECEEISNEEDGEKSVKKSSSRKYSPAAGKQVETEMREMKRGKLKSGRSEKK
jgi:Family of unknown function (DUF6496)